jgi:hypothetical protein
MFSNIFGFQNAVINAGSQGRTFDGYIMNAF